MTTDCTLAQRNQIRAFRTGEQVLIVAEGELPTPGFTVQIIQSPIRIFPPQFNLLRCALPGFFPQVITPYRHAESVRYPADQDVITVHHADGRDDIRIEDCPHELGPYTHAVKGTADKPCPPDADEATGFSKKLSFDEAFANALANLPPSDPSHPDTLTRIQVVEIGALFGGIAGFHDLFVRVCRTHD